MGRSWFLSKTPEHKAFLLWYADIVRLGRTPTAEAWDHYRQAILIPGMGTRHINPTSFYHPTPEQLTYLLG